MKSWTCITTVFIIFDSVFCILDVGGSRSKSRAQNAGLYPYLKDFVFNKIFGKIQLLMQTTDFLPLFLESKMDLGHLLGRGLVCISSSSRAACPWVYICIYVSTSYTGGHWSTAAVACCVNDCNELVQTCAGPQFGFWGIFYTKCIHTRNFSF